MSHIESVFESKSKESAEAGKYLQQWHVAKTHVPQLMNTISHYFPHYSLHDSTHSETILNNIELIMGAEVIDKLSIVDLWLLLSASYYHDLGMVITRDDKLECLKEGSAFINYVRSKQNDETSPIHNYALCFEIKDNKLFHKNNEIDVIYELNKNPISINGNNLNNYIFVDSKMDTMVQLSDVAVGIISRYLYFIDQNGTDCEKVISDTFNENQLNVFRKLNMVLKRSRDFNPLFFNQQTSLEYHGLLNNLIDKYAV